ncbi:Diphthine--ammonia ligase [Dictyocoela roeselum]|nr:Diphthine--ammonia ligase [Dictyocoela roeselum]
MYQSIGYDLIHLYKQCLDTPLFIVDSDMRSINKELEYTATKNDEVEDLYNALAGLKGKIDFEAVSSGAIASNYQKSRIESVCMRLKIASLTPLWMKDQVLLLKEMIDSGIDVRIIKTANPYLTRDVIGMNLKMLLEFLDNLQIKKRDFNFCGEGGEFETICLDADFFKRKIRILDYDVLCDDECENENAVYFMSVKDVKVMNK